jgi:hypothetical protein
MSTTSWWAAWGQSATAIGGFVLGAAGLGLGIYNTLMAREKHGWEKQDRAREERRERWVQEMVEKLKAMPDRPDAPRVLEVESNRHEWAQQAADLGLLKLFKRPDGKWFIRLPS